MESSLKSLGAKNAIYANFRGKQYFTLFLKLDYTKKNNGELSSMMFKLDYTKLCIPYII